MRYTQILLGFFIAMTCSVSCKKDKKPTGCHTDVPTVRTITDQRAVIKVTATFTHPVYLVEQGSIDTRLIPCTPFPMEFYQHDLEVTISGEVKLTPRDGQGPCCFENFMITKIAK
jgi:hypothetical protein